MSDVAWMAWTFLWLSLLCVGGGVGVIPEMQHQVVVNHQWVTAREFVDGYTLAQLTPGPNMLIAAFVGYRAHGVPGALVARSRCSADVVVTVMSPAAVALRGHAGRGRGTRAGQSAWPDGRRRYTLAQSALHDVSRRAGAGHCRGARLALGAAMLAVVAAVLVGWCW